jgi:hypothetical protein
MLIFWGCNLKRSCAHFWVHSWTIRSCDLVKERLRYAPPNEGGLTCWKQSKTILVILIIKHVSPYEKGVNNWNMDKFWPLIEWDENEICWIHYAKRFIIHLLPRSTFTKKWKILRSYKTLPFLSLNIHVELHTTLGFGYQHSLVWSLDSGWLNFGDHWLQLGVSAKDLLIIVTSMNGHLNGVCYKFILFCWKI